MKATFRFLTLLALAALAAARPASAAQALSIDIYGPGQNVVNMCVANPLNLTPGQGAPAEAAEFAGYVQQDLAILPFLRLTQESEILGGTTLGGVAREQIDFNRFQLSKVDLLMTLGLAPDGAGTRIEGRVYEVGTGRLMVGKAYSQVSRENLPLAADLLCAAFLEALTGNGDIFRSVLAFTKNTGKHVREIFTVQPQGRNLTQITTLGGASVSPTWSPDGRYLAFSHHGSSMHSLGVWDRSKDRIFRTKLPGETITGLAFTPENRLVVAMTGRGAQDISLLTPDLLKVDQTLVSSPAIDTSPRFDRDGRTMAFVSDRHGAPQIFVRDMASGEERRVSYNGKYNSTPAISPDGKYVAFARMMPEGHRIFVLDLASGAERQVTFGPGKDETPTFAPDGYFIVFVSNRSGAEQLYLTTRFGGEPRLIPTGGGAVFFPAFGPLLAK
ncbi:MAG: translocation protein TolB [Thermodesulfobacteriota bacterium]